MKNAKTHAPFGLYIHWPFCQSKCPYCDFNSHVSAKIDHDAWARAYRTALHAQGAEMRGRMVGSIYFGGGTPSLMNVETISTILDIAAEIFCFAPDIEITIEANPTSVEINKLRGFRAAGVNRLSLGVQALNDDDLRRLGRNHTAKEGTYALELARQIFPRVSFDLIYARQNQTLKAWEDELNHALDLVDGHFSLYQLTIEANTVFYTRFKQGRFLGLPSQELGADMYEATIEICAQRGLIAYEVSNFARPDQQSRHNMLYWQADDYLGVGPGAYGRFFRDGVRVETSSASTPSIWLDTALGGGNLTTEETLSNDDYLSEMLMMGLRLQDGIARARLERRAGFRQKAAQIENLIDEGLLVLDETSLRMSLVIAHRFPSLSYETKKEKKLN